MLPPAGPFGQAANACFLLAALWGDVLLIRLFLTGAYIFLILGAASGYPRWAGFRTDGPVSIDGLIWAGACLLLHGYALGRLVLDERRISFSSEDEEQLWRFFYRRSGMGRLEMQQVLRRGRWERVPAGRRILGGRDRRLRLCLLVEGVASLHTCRRGWQDGGKPLRSGAVFDKALLNVLGVYLGFDAQDKLLTAVAQTDCLVFSWGLEELSAMATQLGPALASFWRNFALCQLGMEFDLRAHMGAVPLCATGEPEAAEYLQGARSRDFTDPLRPYELRRRSLRSVLAWLWRSLSPSLPPGVRHNALPVNGILARNRVVAVKTAEVWAALSREPSLAGAKAGSCGPEQQQQQQQALGELGEALELAPGVTVRGGVEAQRHLQRLQALEDIEAADVVQLARDLSAHGCSGYLAAVGSPEEGVALADSHAPGIHASAASDSANELAAGAQGQRQHQQQASRKVLKVTVIA